MKQAKDFLGKGFRFPPKINAATGKFVMSSAEDDIRESIYIILMTKKNERAMMPEFGCNLYQYVFELPDAAYLNIIRSDVIEALALWEPRVIDVDVQIDMDDLANGKIILDVSYVVRDTNNPNNLVFPYYLYEGVGKE